MFTLSLAPKTEALPNCAIPSERPEAKAPPVSINFLLDILSDMSVPLYNNLVTN
jgi:hypothetical protein